ncbi:MAG: cytochrome c biogenesis protein ResB [Proteobacteria bacterium]|nr:cytochrome c biogenesis protein ResB [Pseudomonadota bacterium]MBU1649028.1 cytochrome c biogenesis protein ResB [Pseudomonadota bacterium]
MKKVNSIWDFFSSVKLAIITLSLLATSSIIGTIIPQNKSGQWYAQEYGNNLAQLFKILDIPDMYGSWWFLALLGLLCTNLIICSLDRFPEVWRQMKTDGLDTSVQRLKKMGRQKEWRSSSSLPVTVLDLRARLNSSGWKNRSRNSDGGTLLFAQKGAWSRIGVYVVHSSILVIFIGAIIGELYGFKGSVLIPETEQTDKIYTSNGTKTIDLGFTVRCDSFTLELYQSGMPKKYKSQLTLLENGKELFQAPIEVNSPLKYRGITFYQSSYEGYQDFMIKVTNKASGKSKSSIVPFQEQGQWPQEGLTFGVINAEGIGESISRLKIWFSDSKGVPSILWLKDGEAATVERGGGTYLLSIKQVYATGLQVCKDPGVWIVYCGCGLLLLGLVIAFFMSHQRIWLYIKEDDGGTSILFTGSANKNRIGFENIFNDLAVILHKQKG